MDKKVVLGIITMSLLVLGVFLLSPKINSMDVADIEPSSSSLGSTLFIIGMATLILGLIATIIYFVIRKDNEFAYLTLDKI